MLARRRPSLIALRAFEAVARRLNFTEAAHELGVTQAAVSRQVRKLEEELSVRLVLRGATRSSLTDAGEILFSGLHQAFDRIDQSIARISGSGRRDILNVSVAPYFSACWLTPRLMSFFARHGDIDLRLHHSYKPADHKREGIDIGINWGAGTWPGVRKEIVLDGALTPVASERLLSTVGPIGQPAELSGLTLFYEFDLADWKLWFARAGVDMPAGIRAIRLNDSHALRRAAIDGHGVALFFRGLIEEDLRSGVLTQLFPLTVHTGYDYYLNYPDDVELPAKSKAFRRWLREQMAEQPYA